MNDLGLAPVLDLRLSTSSMCAVTYLYMVRERDVRHNWMAIEPCLAKKIDVLGTARMSAMRGIGVGYRSIGDVLPRNWQARLAIYFVARRIICEHHQVVKLEYTNL